MTSLQDMDAKANGLKMIVACEYSGTVRDAFSSLGWDAWSCDLLPTESELTKAEGKHYQGDIFDFIGSRDWDLMIGHPPCDYISYAGTAWWNEPGRVFKRLEGLNFFARLYEAYPHIPHICLENPKSCSSPTHSQIHAGNTTVLLWRPTTENNVAMAKRLTAFAIQPQTGLRNTVR